MKKPSDNKLGMDRSITRRDFVQGVAVTAGALGLPSAATADVSVSAGAEGAMTADYPPTKTGMRGSHPGAYEIAHALARDGAKFPDPKPTDEHYDLVVVGAGISGLAAAHYYQKRFGPDTKILLLENHDDFGGHARRNEFHQSGDMVLSLGGTHNLEWWKFSETVNGFMAEHGVDYHAMREQMDFAYGRDAINGQAMWFDEATYGVNRLVTNFTLSAKLTPKDIDKIPISDAGRESLKRFYGSAPRFEKYTNAEAEDLLSSISYPDFLRTYGGLTEDAVQLFDKEEHGSWGLEMRALSAAEAIWEGHPGAHLFGEEWGDNSFVYPVAMWPDGNASLARLMVAKLMPHSAPDVTADNVAIARFDYSALDQVGANTRLRLNSTVIGVENTDQGVSVTYASSEGELKQVLARHSVLACYHSIIPHLCPAMPDAQKAALKYQVKFPLILTNVLLRNSKALQKLGVDAISCPGRLHARLFLFEGLHTGGYQRPDSADKAVSLVFWGSISPPEDAVDIRSQLRGSRQKLLELSFEDFEREVRTVLDGLLSPAGFDVSEDILAITVNRWPHGYAYEYMQLWDPEWAPGEAPHELARQRFGAITIANADAGASAYTHVAIDQAYRAVRELKDIV
ncbi:NAD(P)-binding protein [Luminiphilus sp.]|nr:FAD/NAD(P)-binding protein [Luminiphilus sp.]MDA9711411.1 NAD(P)-binding protein [Luminiphilus sp.]